MGERDRRTVEELYVNLKIQVLVATATLAWGVNFPTHLVVVKGTEFYDGKLKRYVDMPITDVLQEPAFQNLYSFTHFNPVQTQIFHTLYHSDKNVLLGAPTGSGKTIAAELAIFRVFRKQPEAMVVY